jgi:Zn finger protein HypA/HybF involved in hydrogenase expression
MSAGKIIGYIVAAILILFGVLFIWAAFSPEGQTGWVLVGVVTVAIGLGIIGLIKLREPKPAQPPQEIVQKIDLSGEVELEKLKCQNCGAELDQDSITLKQGAIFVSCPYCGTAYQMVEEPKW